MVKNRNIAHLHSYIGNWRPSWMWYLNHDGRNSWKLSFSAHHLTKILQQKGLFYFQNDLKWSKILIFNISIHILEIGGHVECDILTKMADILKNFPFQHIIFSKNPAAGGLILPSKWFRMVKNRNISHLHSCIGNWWPSWMWYLNQDGRYSYKLSFSAHHLTKIL